MVAKSRRAQRAIYQLIFFFYLLPDMQSSFTACEQTLLSLDFKIKQTLQLTSANPDSCLDLLGQLKELTLTPLVLKKNPHCVETMKRLRRYVGNTRNWQFTEEQKREFNEKAEKLRKISIEIYNSFKVSYLEAVTLKFEL